MIDNRGLEKDNKFWYKCIREVIFTVFAIIGVFFIMAIVVTYTGM